MAKFKSTPPLPLIDISPYLNVDASSTDLETTRKALRSALLTHGFFYLINHSIPRSTTSLVLSHARQFFTTASAQEKSLIQRRDPGVALGDGARGYQQIGDNVTAGHRDWHEALDWYAPSKDGEGLSAEELEMADGGESEGNGDGSDSATTRETMIERCKATGAISPAAITSSNAINGHCRPLLPRIRHSANPSTLSLNRNPPYDLLHGPNLWPSTPPDFRVVFENHVSQMRRLGMAVLRAMGESLELENPNLFAEAASDSFWVMRAIGYPPLQEPKLGTGQDVKEEVGISCGEHSDYGLVTLLLADETPGALQVKLQREDTSNRDESGEWTGVDIVEDAFVVNVGDMVERWTAGWVRSTKHRVVHTGKGFRISVPFFLEPGRNIVVKPLEECVRRVEAQGRKPVEGEIKYWDHLVSKVGGNFYTGG